MDSSDKIHYNNRDNLKQNFFFQGIGQLLWFQVDRWERQGRVTFFFVSFQFSKYKFYIEFTCHTNYLQTLNFGKVKTLPRNRTREGRCCLPLSNSVVGVQGPSAHGANGFTHSVAEPALFIPKRASTVPFLYLVLTRFPSSVVFLLVFMFGVSMFPGHSIWSLSIL